MKNKNTISVYAHHIFLDIVSYTKRTIEAQSDIIKSLNTIVESAIKEQKIEEKIIFIPTGDGMCISILNAFLKFDIHLNLALQILKHLEVYNSNEKLPDSRKFEIRIGMDENIDNVIRDINNQENISGNGINLAARLESLAGSNQILVGTNTHNRLYNRDTYANSFRSYSAEIKHGIKADVHQYIGDPGSYLNRSRLLHLDPLDKTSLKHKQAHYIAHCLKFKDTIDKELSSNLEKMMMQVILMRFAIACTKNSQMTKPEDIIFQKNILESISDIELVTDLNSCFKKLYLEEMSHFFQAKFLIVNESGYNRLKENFEEIFNLYEL